MKRVDNQDTKIQQFYFTVRQILCWFEIKTFYQNVKVNIELEFKYAHQASLFYCT